MNNAFHMKQRSVAARRLWHEREREMCWMNQQLRSPRFVPSFISLFALKSQHKIEQQNIFSFCFELECSWRIVLIAVWFKFHRKVSEAWNCVLRNNKINSIQLSVQLLIIRVRKSAWNCGSRFDVAAPQVISRIINFKPRRVKAYRRTNCRCSSSVQRKHKNISDGEVPVNYGV